MTVEDIIALNPILQFSKIRIEAEAPERAQQKFESDYFAATGKHATLGDAYMTQENKWGLELRCYFDASDTVVQAIEGMGYHVQKDRQGYLSSYTYRVDSGPFVWSLFKMGYKLGDN